jgi:transposase
MSLLDRFLDKCKSLGMLRDRSDMRTDSTHVVASIRNMNRSELVGETLRATAAPWRLAVVTILQFAERLSDRDAAEAVRTRIDWKYLLGLELSDAGFDYSILSRFRD